MKLRIHVHTYNLHKIQREFPFFFPGCLVNTLKEMFPGETEEDLITTLTKNNFDLETSVNQVLSSEEDEGILIILYFESG